MNGLNFFHQLIIILGFSIPVIYIFNKIKLPSIIGFLITGIIIGPFGLKLIDDMAGIQLMAEIGVAFLLFTIGIEIQLSRFLKHLSEILFTGGLQILCTFIVGDDYRAYDAIEHQPVYFHRLYSGSQFFGFDLKDSQRP